MPITHRVHFLMCMYVAFFCCLSIIWGRHAGKMGEQHRNARLQAITISILWILYNAYYFSPKHFDWSVSLPLHVCDLLAPSAAVALGLGFRSARTILYFCAIPLATQAVLTPTGNQDPTTVRFWLYWTLHAAILALSLLDLVVMRFRPRLRDYGTALMMDMLYVAVIVPIDILFRWNYGYLGNRLPANETALNFLGQWPLRILTMLCVVFLMQAILLVPWLVGRKGS